MYFDFNTTDIFLYWTAPLATVCNNEALLRQAAAGHSPYQKIRSFTVDQRVYFFSFSDDGSIQLAEHMLKYVPEARYEINIQYRGDD